MNKTVIALVEHPELDWGGRLAYVAAKYEERRTDLYIGDLVWLLTKNKYKLETPAPSEIELARKKVDRRSAQEIKESVLKWLRGAK